MASKFLDLNEAAAALGVTPDQLMEMRQQGEIHGYRDGGTWKFKPEEVERVKAERGGGGGGEDQYNADFDHLMPEPSPDDEASSELDSVSILVSDESLGKSPPTSSSTIIGKKKSGDSDIKLADEKPAKGDSDLGLAVEAGSSDLKLAGDSGVLSGKEMKLDTSAGGTGELELASEGPAALGSDALSLEGSDLALGEDSDDLVLGGSGVGSDVSLDPGGSGINLGKPSDSGLSLERPLELGGSHVESLELPEDEDMVSLTDSDADPDQATMLKADEEFSLGPQVDSFGDDSSDSGSQVIALESEGFDDSAVTMLGPAGAEPTPLVAAGPDAMMPGGGFGPGMQAPLSQPTPANYVPAAPAEADYSLWNVLGLLCVVMVMSVGGMLMVDLLRNMWAFDSSASASTAVMDMIIEALKM